MTAYLMARANVTDEAAYGEYARRAGEACAKYGGRFLARGGRFVTLEGKEYARNVIIEFDSVEQAEAYYNSPEYREAWRFQKDAAVRDLVIVEGL